MLKMIWDLFGLLLCIIMLLLGVTSLIVSMVVDEGSFEYSVRGFLLLIFADSISIKRSLEDIKKRQKEEGKTS